MEDPSRKMHDYLERKQRRQEEFWLRRYGKVLYPVLPKPATKLAGDVSGTLLPPIKLKNGLPPMFQANGPIKSFPMKGSDMNPDRKHKAVSIPYHPSGQTTFQPPFSHHATIHGSLLPPMGWTPPMPPPGLHTHTAPPLLPQPLPFEPSSPGQEDELKPRGSGLSTHMLQVDEPSAHEPASENGFKGGHSPSAHVRLSARHSKQLPGGNLVTSQAGPIVLPPLAEPPSPGARPPKDPSPRVKVLRDLNMETNVLKAIKARKDVLERLRVAGDKLSAIFGEAAPLVLSQADPLVRLFYRLVSTLRQRTLDAVECIAAWKRKTGSTEPFVYYGRDYLATVGPDLHFLDELPFLSSRLTNSRAVEDPFLVDVTPDGIPIEEATTMDLRRAGHRLSSDALRIRMARRAMAKYLHHSIHRPSSTSSSIGELTDHDLADLLSSQHAPLHALEGQLLLEALVPMVHNHVITRVEPSYLTLELAKRLATMVMGASDSSTMQRVLDGDHALLVERVQIALDALSIKLPEHQSPPPPAAHTPAAHTPAAHIPGAEATAARAVEAPQQGEAVHVAAAAAATSGGHLGQTPEACNMQYEPEGGACVRLELSTMQVGDGEVVQIKIVQVGGRKAVHAAASKAVQDMSGSVAQLANSLLSLELSTVLVGDDEVVQVTIRSVAQADGGVDGADVATHELSGVEVEHLPEETEEEEAAEHQRSTPLVASLMAAVVAAVVREGNKDMEQKEAAKHHAAERSTPLVASLMATVVAAVVREGDKEMEQKEAAKHHAAERSTPLVASLMATVVAAVVREGDKEMEQKEAAKHHAAERSTPLVASLMAAVVAAVVREGDDEMEEEAAAAVQGDEEALYEEPPEADIFVVEYCSNTQSLLSGVEDLLEQDDGLFIDFAIGAMVESLEKPHVDRVAEGSFTVAGWEIDRQLDALIGSLEASTSARASDMGGAYYTASVHRLNPNLTGGLEVRGASPLHVPASYCPNGHVYDSSPKFPQSALQGVDEGTVQAMPHTAAWQGKAPPPATAGSVMGKPGKLCEPSPSRDGRMIDRIVDDLIETVDLAGTARSVLPTPLSSTGHPPPSTGGDLWNPTPSREGRTIDRIVDDIVTGMDQL